MFSMAQSVGMIGSSFLGGELLNRAGASVIWYAAGALGILALAVLLTYSRFPMPLHERESLQRAKAAAAGGA
jgi:predicted MFS family arabinose efflux permease